MALATESSDQDLVVLLNVVQASVPGHERRDLLAVLNQLHTNALADGRVGLFGLNASGRVKEKDDTGISQAVKGN